MTSDINRFDHVGSFLRPESLLQARQEFEAGQISESQLKDLEDQAIISLIQQQEQAGLQTITDGEFRRASWHCDFFWGFDGVQSITNEPNGSVFEGKVYGITARIDGKITGHNHPFIDHWRFTRQHASDSVDVKLTIPAPSQFIQEALRDINIDATREHYEDLDSLKHDVVQAYVQFLNELADAGCRTVQFDDCTWARLISAKDHSGQSMSHQSIQERKDLYIELNNGVINQKPQELTINTHVCRGNFVSTWFASGGYDSVADPLFTQSAAESFYLEYDSKRAGSFAPLADLPSNKRLVLGLVTSKDGALEDKAQLIERIHEAANYHPLENISISPQCGFSSNAIGNKISPDDQWQKIALLKEIAEEVWPANE